MKPFNSKIGDRRNSCLQSATLCNTVNALSQNQLALENARYAGTGGISANNGSRGFVPGFYNTHTQTARVSCYADGAPAPIHILDGLPDTWITGRDSLGQVVQTAANVIAGFLREGRFYTREEAASLCSCPPNNDNCSY